MASTSVFVFLSLLSFVLLRSWLKKRDTKGLPLPPGPPPLPYIGSVLGVDADYPWLTYSKWGAKFGEIVYYRLFSEDVVILNSERVARDLLDRRSHNYSTRPQMFSRVLDLFGFEYFSIFLPYSDRWRLHRRIFHQAFRSEAVPSFCSIQMRSAHNMVLNLLHSSEEYGTHLHAFSTSIIMSIVYDYATLPRDDPFIAMVERSSEILTRELVPKVACVVGEFPILEKLPSWFPGASFIRGAILQRSLIPQIVDIPFEHVKKNMEAGTAASSMVSDALLRVLEKARDQHEAAFLEKAVKEASATGCIAASETTTSALYVFLLAMVLHPEVQARAQEEIDSVIGKDFKRMPDWSDRASMPYVDAVIRETLRWFPVAPMGIPHGTVDDDVYEGYYIPKGATVIANIWSMARNPEKYPDPTRFIPERHMSKMTSEESPARGPDDISFVFGFGRRVCVGRYVADASLFAAVVNILAVFRVERAPGWNIGPDCEGVMWAAGLTVHPVFPCIFTPRQVKDRVVELIRA
ncbi:cytochrome P450 [Rhizopogon salebrosus TDB-379]|nr:cytochrome P450 [Rhizopogon salebrosus TDB-379]